MRTPGIRHYLGVLVLAASLPVAGLALALFLLSMRSGYEVAWQRVEARTTFITAAVQTQMDALAGTLDVLSASPALADGDLAAFHTQARAITGERVDAVSLIRPDGVTVLNSRVPPGQIPPSFSVPEAEVRRAAAEKRLIITGLFSGATSRRNIFAMMKPVSVAGRPHVLAVGLFASRFEPLFDRTLAPWSVALLDGGTKTVAMLPREDNLAERHHARIAETVEAGGQGRLALPHADGTEHLLVVERIPPSGWVAVSALPRSIAEEPAKRTALIYAVGALLLALPSVLLASWLGWRLARSMKGLAAFGSAMGHPSPLAALSLPTEGAPCQELEVVAEALQNAAGEIAARDAQLRQQRDLAEESATRIASQSEELARSNTELEQFAYIASHDLREPLRMVSSFLTLLERHLDDRMDDEAREFMGYARDGALRMDQMILDLLQYSRVGRTGTAVETVDLNRLVEQVRRELAPKIAEAGAEVVVESPGLPVIAGDQGELERLFLNLMGNALKYRAPERPARITVSARTAEDGWQVTVADNGIGIEPQFHQRIFAIFQRLHTREKYEGNGIGLAICKKVVEHHGGRIWVDSTPGSGSAFHFTLPAGPPPLPHS